MKKKFYITTAISYPNGPPHMGHAYEAIAADCFARFKRLDGAEVYFVTGTDDHGQKIYRAAQEQGITPKQMTDELSQKFIQMCDFFNISYDRFIRTSEKVHHEAVRHLWRRMEKDIYKDVYTGWYSVREEAFYTDAQLQKDEKGEWITPLGSSVEWMEEESYFFRLSAYEDKLLSFYSENPDFIQPKARYNEIVSFVKGGLKDISLSRSSFDWGVKVPTDERHIVYVWLDALVNYLTACGYPDENAAKFSFWAADLHLIGKDIIRFHTVYWTAFLMSAGLEIPKAVFAHGMILTGEGEKMSKSLNNVIDPFEQAKLYGVDQFRYFLLSDTPFGQDGAYSEDLVIARINADLANDLGNLAQRCLAMVQKHWDGKVPLKGKQNKEASMLLFLFNRGLKEVYQAMDKKRFDQALAEIWRHIGAANRYFANEQPWKLNPSEQGALLWTMLEILRQMAILLQPFMPDTMVKLLDLLAIPESERDFNAFTNQIREGQQLPQPSALFPRYKLKKGK